MKTISKEHADALKAQFECWAQMQYDAVIGAINTVYAKLPDGLSKEEESAVIDDALNMLSGSLGMSVKTAQEQLKAESEKFDMDKLVKGMKEKFNGKQQ